jgi:3D (Asp-Asp-Asp) domain-containing protein
LLAATAAAVAAATAGEAATVPTLRAQADQLRASKNGALLDLYAAQAALDRSRLASARLDARAGMLAAAAASVRRRAALARRSSHAARERVHAALRALYVEGEADPVSIILGATSLDEALEGIDGLSRAVERNERLVRELRATTSRLQRLQRVLAERRRALERARSSAAAATAWHEHAVAARRATLGAIRRQADLTDRQLDALAARAASASAASTRIAAPPRGSEAASPGTRGSATMPAPTPVATPATGGTRTLEVEAVAYHLPGRTASGLPVGVGVIAVDPRLIPLGTKLYVPGYGPAVAADVGSAIVGSIIDLWMPSTAQAQAWGRRTVTITVYG